MPTARTKHEKMVRRKMEVTDYVPGTNALLDAIHEGESIKIVQASYGRVPIIADTDEEAMDRYIDKFFKRIVADSDESDEEEG